MAGVGVAPAQVGMQGPRLKRVVGVVRVGDGELPQRPEAGLDRVRPRGVGRGETQLGLVLFRPAADVAALVCGQVVQDDVDRGAVRSGGADVGVRTSLPSCVQTNVPSCQATSFSRSMALRRFFNR